MSEFNTEDLDEVIASTNGSLVQMLALQLKNELAKNTALTSQLESVVAENAALKDDYRSTPALRNMGWPKTPSTDAFLAEVRASGVDEVCLKISNAIVNCYQDEQVGLDAAATICGDFAAYLRQEAK